jgi:hypothetical protein
MPLFGPVVKAIFAGIETFFPISDIREFDQPDTHELLRYRIEIG